MPKYRLKSQHYIDGRLLEAGDEIGEGTEVPFLGPDGKPLPPTPEMEGLDEASQKLVDEVTRKYMNPETSISLKLEDK